MKNPKMTTAWHNLSLDKERLSNTKINDLFEADRNRFDRYSIKFNDILLDYSKNIIDEQTINHLFNLLEEVNLKDSIENMFIGKKINFTENRAVLHIALRYKGNDDIYLDNINISEKIRLVKSKMKNFSNDVRNGLWTGYEGHKIKDVVNIGIGGSDLGPAMVCDSLKFYADRNINIHFVSNVDSNDIKETLKTLNPQTTLFIIASKTFTTIETMTNATTAKDWFLSNCDADLSDIAKHFVALSTNKAACQQFGIPEENMFEFWDWVGGRYSLWSAIGLSICVYLGYDIFERLLDGAYYIDTHFRNTSFNRNIPVILALMTVWYNNFWNYKSHAIIPYNQYLIKLTDFLQQLDMESNGKYIDSDGNEVDYSTGCVIWGTAGTNAQHSFFQLLHQGTQVIPVDFIISCKPLNYAEQHNDILVANCIAQSEALMKGKSKNEVIYEFKKQNKNIDDIEMLIPHKIFKGNIPSNTIMLKKLTPETLGSLIAIYEHKVFVEGLIWNINSFDQWGVELGKQLANNIMKEIINEDIIKTHDSSTNGLLNYYKSFNK